MIIKSLRWRDIGDPFRKEVAVDVSSLPPGLNALIGDNGGGKSHFLELLGPAPEYRQFVSYGETLISHVNPGAREAFVEKVFEMANANVYRTLVQLDPQLGKTEAYLHHLVGENWVPLGGPRVREYDEALAKILPPLDFMTASIFAPAGGEGSILTRSPGERKAFFMRMTGNDALELMSEQARERYKGILPQLDETKRRLANLQNRAERHEEIKGKLAAIDMELSAAEEDVKKAQTVLDAAAQKHLDESTRIAAERSAHEAKVAQRQDLVARKEVLHIEIGEIRESYKAKKKDYARAIAAADEVRETEKRIGLSALEAEVVKLEEEEMAYAQEIERARIAAEAETTQWAEMVSLTSKGKELRGRAERMAEKAKDVCDRCPLGEELRLTQEALNQARDAYRSMPEDLNQRPKQKAFEDLMAKVKSFQAEKLKPAKIRRDEARRKNLELDELKARAAQAASLLKDVQELEERGKKKHAELEAIVVPDVADFTPSRAQDVVAATQRLSDARSATEAAHGVYKAALSEKGALMGALREVGDPGAEIVGERLRFDRLDIEAADWAVVERACGRNGAQALVIDSLGGEVTQIINDLLVAGWDSRFQVVIETLAPKADGGQKEVFDIRLIDTSTGNIRRQGSTGQMVVIDEAIRLGLAIYNVRKSGVPLRTLFRDEAVGALSQTNANRYIAMLRRAMEIGGFHQCFFVSHHEDVWGQADGKLFVENGEVRVEV